MNNDNYNDLVNRLWARAAIRRKLRGNEQDRIADLCDEAAEAIMTLRKEKHEPEDSKTTT